MLTQAVEARHGGSQPLPVRICIATPPGGIGGQFPLMRRWLDDVCGPSGWASSPAGFSGVVNDAIAFYFADPAAARAFVARFACGYRGIARHPL